MAAALALWLIGAVAGADAPPAPRCLPAQDGFLEMRLRGSIERDIRWQEPELACTGMPRPDGRGLRVQFSGPLDGGELAVVIAAPALAPGASGRGVPVNVTLLDRGGERIYGTQGEDRCELDEVTQVPVGAGAFAARNYRISGRGFCIAPARALDGDGAVMLTRFDFAGLVTLDAGPAT
jgi:hypothetical protein